MALSRIAIALGVTPALILGLIALPSPASATTDLTVTLTDNLADGVVRDYSTSGSNITYTLTVENVGDEAANEAVVGVILSDAIMQATWIASFSGGAEGPAMGAGVHHRRCSICPRAARRLSPSASPVLIRGRFSLPLTRNKRLS